LDPSLDISQYAHTAWKIRDGFFKGVIRSMAQTPDGYLWLGTEFGLVRFDGLRTIPFQAPSGQQLPSNDIWGLLAARDGTLWIGMANGLASWKDRKLTTYAELAGLYVFRIFEDRAGTVWVSGVGVRGRFCSIQKGKLQQCRGEDGSLGHGVVGVYEDSKSRLWVGVANGLWRWNPDPKFYPLPGTGDSIQGFAEDVDGTLLITTADGLQRFVDGRTEPYPLPRALQPGLVNAVLRDRDGSLWLGTRDQGVVHLHQRKAETFIQPDGLSSDAVFILFEDHEGNVWVISSGGLDRFRDVPVATLSKKQGLAGEPSGPVLASRDGSVWFATSKGPERWKNGEFTLYRKPGSPRLSRPIQPVHEVEIPGLPSGGMLAMYQDDHDRIWFGTRDGTGYFADGHFAPLKGGPGEIVHNIAEGSSGDFWIDDQDEGLFHAIAGNVVERIPWAKLGIVNPNSVVSDRALGGLWFGLTQGGLVYFSDHQIRKSYGTADGLGQGRVSHLRLDAEGTLWASTPGGLSRLKNGRISTLAGKNGLPCDGVHWSIEDNDAALWMYMSCGLVRIAREELNGWATAVNTNNDAKWTIKATVFDSSDGIRNTNSVGTFSPLVAKTADGRLWFSNSDGINIVDPARLPFNKLPPPVRIEQITADRKNYDPDFRPGPLPLPALLRDLQIDYTAYSLVAPEKVLFRYKLEPHDRDWQDVGNRRQAFYNDLPPGNYRFRVTAANNSGVWNEDGATFDFSVAPAYYQTTLFRLSALVVFLAALAVLYQLRLRRVAKDFELRLEERTRIARDLHDTLLQGCLSASMQLDMALDQVPDDLPIKAKLTYLQRLLARVVDEGRSALRGLRVTDATTHDLEQAFARARIEAGNEEVDFRVIVEGKRRPLDPLIRDEVYRIGREAILNAYRHANAHHIEVEIDYSPRLFRLSVRDDGRGIDPAILSSGRDGHWGLSGMRERAERIGARIEVSSRPAAGTEIDLSVPSKIAFQSKPSISRNWWSRLGKTRNGNHQ
jgi:signal transduction histidine kinase/ligand-binding sensor domain-containing protein